MTSSKSDLVTTENQKQQFCNKTEYEIVNGGKKGVLICESKSNVGFLPK